MQPAAELLGKAGWPSKEPGDRCAGKLHAEPAQGREPVQVARGQGCSEFCWGALTSQPDLPVQRAADLNVQPQGNG